MPVHELKTWIEPFKALRDGRKVHEVRRDDRHFHVGDDLMLREWDEHGQRYTGRFVHAVITYKSDGGTWGLPEGLCVMSIQVMHAGSSA